MQEAKINLGKVVRIARKRKRITQDYLAEKVGVQPRTILEIENGRGNPRFENLFVMVRHEKEHCKEEVSNKTNG